MRMARRHVEYRLWRVQGCLCLTRVSFKIEATEEVELTKIWFETSSKYYSGSRCFSLRICDSERISTFIMNDSDVFYEAAISIR